MGENSIFSLNSSLNRLIVPVVLALAGCQTQPPEDDVSQACPTVEVPECPVCEVQACPEPSVEAAPVEKTVTKTVISTGHVQNGDAVLPVIGSLEWALVEPSGLIMEARVDTGAETSSIHAEDIKLVEKDGKRYVRFTLEHPETGEIFPVERRLHRRILVKQQTEGGEPDRRYVVRMWVTLGDKRTWLDVSLTDRENFEYPLLLGRNKLMDEFVVDVSRRHTLSKKKLREKAE